MGRRVGSGLLVLLILLATVGFSAGTAAADTPGTTATVTPNTNLAATQNVSVSGTGFGHNQPGTIRQTIEIGSTQQFGLIIANFTTNSSGAFGPVTVTVNKTFTTIGNTQVTCSTSQPCSILAATDQTEQDDHAPISFATTSNLPCQAVLATLNALITAFSNSPAAASIIPILTRLQATFQQAC